MTAALMAEALAAAERETPKGECPARYHGFEEGGGGDYHDVRGSLDVQTGFARLDVMDAALGHLAERVEKAEAERATLVQALRRVRDEVAHARDHGTALYMLHKHTERALNAVGEDPHKASGAYAEKGAPRG